MDNVSKTRDFHTNPGIKCWQFYQKSRVKMECTLWEAKWEWFRSNGLNEGLRYESVKSLSADMHDWIGNGHTNLELSGCPLEEEDIMKRGRNWQVS